MNQKTYWALFLFLLMGLIARLSWERDLPEAGHKLNGVSLVNPHQPIDSAEMAAVRRVSANWVAIIPYAFSRQGEPEVYFNHERQWWGEREAGTEELIRLAQANGLRVMLKPHVWMHGHWIGDFNLTNEADWQAWERAYDRYIFTFAHLAARLDVPLFCIGTEYKLAVQARPQYWSALPDRIREVYSGELVYAANWDEYVSVPFWEKLDYIGVDGYFPLVHTPNPSLEQLAAAWVPVKRDLEEVAQQFGRPILFTEFGYQSADGAAGNHWEVKHDSAFINEALQAKAYQALFSQLWQEPWFAGGFFWKWHFEERRHERRAADFTPQHKEAEQVILQWYSRYSDIKN